MSCFTVRSMGRGLVLAVVLLIVVPSRADVRMVDDDAPLGGDGQSWATAYKYLQDALAAAQASGGTITEIRVAAGTYKPDQNAANPGGTGDRYATFQLLSGVTLQGGYAGFGAPDPDERDITAHETILSGNGSSYHVVIGSGTASTAVLDGFTVTGGSALGAGFPDYCGGGLFNGNGSPTVLNCTFRNNGAYGSPGGSGGGMYSGGGNPILVDCKFIQNACAVSGGGICTSGGSLTLVGCMFSKNSSGWGGGIYNSSEAVIAITNCLFAGNTAIYGGAIDNERNVVLTVTNCTFSGNTAPNGRAIGCGAYGQPSAVQLTNCILWDGGDEIWNGDGSEIIVTYSDVQDGFPGDGNINADPRFIDADGPDDVVGTADDDLRLGLDSPCIDAATNEAVPADVTTDLDGNPRFFDVRCILDTGSGEPPIVDMGPYEFPTEVPSSVRADYDGDCDVDQYDRDLFEFCASGPGIALPPSTACLYVADFDGDSDADQADFAVFQRCYSGEGIPADPHCAE